MHPADIVAALRKRGITQQDLADRLGQRGHQVVSAVVNGRARSRRTERAISEATGLPLQKLWPKWYGDKRAAA